jgi:phosphoglycolate phosphatase-like HAD superfamily hydrolase
MSAARAAGVRCIGLTQGGVPAADLFQAGATWVRHNLTDVREFLEKELV